MSAGGPDLSENASKGRALIARAFAAGSWAVAAEAVTRVAQPLVLLALARVLTPEDFGLVTVASIIVGFAQVFWDAGLAKALVQREADPQDIADSANSVFWANLVVSLFLFAGVFVAAVPIAHAVGDPRIVALVRVQGLMIPLLAIGSVPAALLQRRLQYRPLFVARLAAAIAPGLIGVPLALGGAGYWALVAGAITGTTAQCCALFRLSAWRPCRRWANPQLRTLARFSVWSMGEASLSWSILWLDVALVGLHFTSHELGLYRTGGMAVSMAFGLTIGSLMPVLFTAFSRMQSMPAQLERTLVQAIKVVSMLGLAIATVALSAPSQLSEFVFGEQWRGMGVVVFYLTIAQSVSWLAAPIAEFYRAIGRPDLNAKVIAGSLVYYAPAFIWAAQGGLERFLQVRVLVGFIAFGVHVGVAWRCANYSPLRFMTSVGWFVFACAAAAVVGTAVSNRLEGPLFVQLLAVCTACGMTYALACAKEWPFVVSVVRHRCREQYLSANFRPGAEPHA